jgi:hypothetical protein
MIASNLVRNNTNPITPANALTPFDYYRFVWDASGVWSGLYQVRGWATMANGDTGAAVATAVLVQLVDPSDTATEYSGINTTASASSRRSLRRFRPRRSSRRTTAIPSRSGSSCRLAPSRGRPIPRRST